MNRSGTMKKQIALLALVFSVTACGIGTVRWSMNDSKFQQENQPIREVRLAVFTDGSFNESSIISTVENVSDSLTEEVGVTFRVNRLIKTWWGSKRFAHIADTMKNTLTTDDDWDIAIAVTSYDSWEKIMANTIGATMAVTDEYYRRYIIVKELSKQILMHEIVHCFVFEHEHAWTGVMFPMMVRILPLMPSIPVGGNGMTPAFRREFLKNKFRVFDNKPVVVGY